MHLLTEERSSYREVMQNSRLFHMSCETCSTIPLGCSESYHLSPDTMMMVLSTASLCGRA